MSDVRDLGILGELRPEDLGGIQEVSMSGKDLEHPKG